MHPPLPYAPALARPGAGMKPQAFITAPEEGRAVWLLGDRYTFKLTGADTDGALAVMEATIFPQNGPPPHIHRAEDKALYILEGTFSILCGGRLFRAAEGAFVFVPRGTLHTYQNSGGAPGRLLMAFSPAGFEKFFDVLGIPASAYGEPPPIDPALPERLLSVAPQFNLEILPPDA